MPTEKRERLSVQLKPGTKERLEIQAVKDGRSLSNLIKKIPSLTPFFGK